MQLKHDNFEDIISFDDHTLDEVTRDYADEFSAPMDLNFKIPMDHEEFYKDFGYFNHEYKRDERGLPAKVTSLSWFQKLFASWDYGIALKSNKIGMTSSEMLGDFHTRLMPQYAGGDCIIQASKQEIANELVMKLKKRIAASKKYSRFLVRRPDLEEWKEEKTKVGVIVIRNPYNPKEKSKIYGVGNSTSSVYSRMGINRIHITDPALLKIKKQDEFFSGLISRLANSGGQIKIEGVPMWRTGWFWKLCRVMFNIDDAFEDARSAGEHYLDEATDFDMPREITTVFNKMKLTIDDGVDAGVIPAKVRDLMQKTIPPAQYRRVFMAEFVKPEGAVFGSFPTGKHEVEEW